MSLARGSPVLVFDLDDTLISSEKVYDVSIRASRIASILVNYTLLEIIHNAKDNGWKVLLLTNNENSQVIFNEEKRGFIEVALAELTKAYNQKYTPVLNLFDHILTAEKRGNNANGNKRTYLKKRIDSKYTDKNGIIHIRYYEKPVKSLEDVRHMLGYPVKGANVYFFDDDHEHQLCSESNFVHITPPFGKGKDETAYPIIYAMGGRRTQRRCRGRGRRGPKGSRRKLKELRHGM